MPWRQDCAAAVSPKTVYRPEKRGLAATRLANDQSPLAWQEIQLGGDQKRTIDARMEEFDLPEL